MPPQDDGGVMPLPAPPEQNDTVRAIGEDGVARVRAGILDAPAAPNLTVIEGSRGKPKRGGAGEGDPPPPQDDPPAAPDAPWPGAPFAILGKSGRAYWFVDASGEIIDMPVRALGQWSDVMGLAGGNEAWLAAYWPAYDKEGEPTGSFNVKKTAGAIMRKCTGMPLFDPAAPRRRYGLWSVVNDDGKRGSALHLGDRVIWCGQERPAGFSKAGALWPSLAARPAPAAPASHDVGRTLEALLQRWNWTHPEAAKVLLGLVVNGMLGGLTPWRAHGFVVGDSGAGKTTLLRFIASLCPLTVYRNNFTEAGVRQTLSETAASVILDEAEGDDHGDHMLKRMLELFRQASSPGGVQGARGSPGQEARSFSIAASAIYGAILAPALTQQDARRIVMLQLMPLAGAATGFADEIAGFAAEHGPALWGRAIASAVRVMRLFALFKARLVADGETQGTGDQLGIIVACHWAMTEDETYDPDDVGHPSTVLALEAVRWLILPATQAEGESTGNQALQRLLSMPLDMAGDKMLLGQALARFRQLGRDIAGTTMDGPGRVVLVNEQDKMDRLLQGHGVRWGRLPLRASAEAPSPPVGIYVAAWSHPRLLRAFDGTAWAGQRWAAAMAQLPGAVGGRDGPPVHIGGSKGRTCWVSRETLDRLTEDG